MAIDYNTIDSKLLNRSEPTQSEFINYIYFLSGYQLENKPADTGSVNYDWNFNMVPSTEIFRLYLQFLTPSQVKRSDFILYKGRGVSQNPDIMWGAPVIDGTRIPVHSIMDKIAYGISPEEITIKHYPVLSIDDIDDAYQFSQRQKNIQLFNPLSTARIIDI